MMKIIFICSGNTSRSPMAEGIFGQIVNDVEVSSAGFSTLSGEKASENAVLVCKKHNIDLSGFRTTNISDVDFGGYDLVLAATESARDKIMRLYPNITAYTIRQYAGGYDDLDIKDPSEDSLGDHVECFFEIKEALERILENHNNLRGVDANFKYLDGLIQSGRKEILLSRDIVLADGEEAVYENGIGVDVDDVVIDGNNHVIDGKGRAGIFNITGKNIAIKNIIFRDSFSDDGAAISICKTDVSMENIEIHNSVSKNNGAAIFINKATLKIDDSSFMNNHAMRGAAIYSNEGRIEISRSCFSDNISFRNGGAIRAANSHLKIDDCDFTKNKSRFGGAIYSFFTKLEISRSYFISNLVECDGGAIYNYHKWYDACAKIADSLFRDNLAQKEGGAIKLNWGKINLSGCDLLENNAEKGGAAYVSEGSFVVDSSRVDKNFARDGGGAIFGACGLKVIDSSISYNCADSVWGSGGGAIHNTGFATVCGSILSHNAVKGYGGAIYNGGYKGKLKIEGSQISDNHADDGGSIFNSLTCEVELDDCVFKDNEPEVDFDKF